MNKPVPQNSEAAKEMEKIEKQLDTFNDHINSLTHDRMNEAKKLEVEPQTKLSAQDTFNSKDIYLKPFRTIACQDKFNENYREAWNFDKEPVYFTAENREIIGESIDMWTKPYAGVPAEWWKIPVNKPLYAPRYVAEQVKRCYYHRLVMRDKAVDSDSMGTYSGEMAVDTTVQRLDAVPAVKRRSIFMGSRTF